MKLYFLLFGKCILRDNFGIGKSGINKILNCKQIKWPGISDYSILKGNKSNKITNKCHFSQ